LAIHVKGEKVLAQSKITAPPPISKFFGKLFSISIFQISIPQKILSQLVYFKEEVFKN
jgi:hypothetical protein